jgi:hypothetical protein
MYVTQGKRLSIVIRIITVTKGVRISYRIRVWV